MKYTYYAVEITGITEKPFLSHDNGQVNFYHTKEQAEGVANVQKARLDKQYPAYKDSIKTTVVTLTGHSNNP